MFSHHQVARERLSVRQRMSDILSTLRETAFLEFPRLFRPQEGRMGVTVTFIAILELMKEGLIEIVQAEAYAAIHIRTASAGRRLTVVEGGASDADLENEAALAQPELPDENVLDEEGGDEIVSAAQPEEVTSEDEHDAGEHDAGEHDAGEHDMVATNASDNPDPETST